MYYKMRSSVFYYAFCKNGKIDILIHEKDSADFRDLIKPIDETRTMDIFREVLVIPEIDHRKINTLKEYLTHQYEKWGRFGPFGDVIRIKCVEDGNNNQYSIDYIANQAYYKPGLAADLLMFIKDRSGKIFFIGIKRRFPPGEGKPATLGGFLNVERYYLQTPAYALLHEGREEAGMLIEPRSYDRDRLKNEIFADELSVKVTLAGDSYYPVMQLIGTLPTSKEEELPEIEQKRVYWTTGYSIMVDTGQDLDADIIKRWFKPGDDAEEVIIHEVKPGDAPEFHIEHHKTIYYAALKMYRIAG